MSFQENQYNIQRYDFSNDRSLRAFSAADELLLSSFNEIETANKNLGLYNDRFGFLSCHLSAHSPQAVITHKSQEKAIALNLENNSLDSLSYSDPLSTLDVKLDMVLIKIPKSLDLFHLFLGQIAQNSTDEVMVICGFMTRHFTPKMIQIAEQYFEVVTQSRALKKARVLTLKNKKQTEGISFVKDLNYDDETYQQYYGVFSGEHIDYATQFFLKHIEIKNSQQQVLDLGSGNGILAKEIVKQHVDAEMHLMDDAFLAVESAKLNIKGEKIHHYYDNDLRVFNDEMFDAIVTNPPFHFEHEINIQVTLELFKECFRCLKENGNLQIVANHHLNYKTHLSPLFSSVKVVAEDKKFVVYKCEK